MLYKNCLATVGVCVFRALASAGALFFGGGVKIFKMLRQYSNKTIYKNFKIVKVLSIISIVFSVLTIMIYTYNKYANHPNAGFLNEQWFFYFIILVLPLDFLIPSINANKKVTRNALKHEESLNNDFINTLTIIIVSFIPYIYLIFNILLFACFGSPNPLTWAYFCGYMLPAHIFLYASDIFLIYTCILIKQEWQNNPPTFIVERQKQQAKEKLEKETKQKTEQYKTLIHQCGIKFFIKYYTQIKRLPLRDVTIYENYTPKEKEERLLAAKRIIDLDLAEFTLTEIIKSYSNVLSQSEIMQAQSILDELKSKTNK